LAKGRFARSTTCPRTIADADGAASFATVAVTAAGAVGAGALPQAASISIADPTGSARPSA
jgi:hypothetical protein